MKTLKYRSALAGICVAALSVFLFTACEKESDGPTASQEVDIMSKFKRLTFSSGSTSTSTSSTSSGTFSGGGGSISYGGNEGGPTFVKPEEADALEYTYSDNDKDIQFTDPLDQGPAFGINIGSFSFGVGSGDVTLTRLSDALNVSSQMDVVVCIDGEAIGQPNTSITMGLDFETSGQINSLEDFAQAFADITDPNNIRSSVRHIMLVIESPSSTIVSYTYLDPTSDMGDTFWQFNGTANVVSGMRVITDESGTGDQWELQFNYDCSNIISEP